MPDRKGYWCRHIRKHNAGELSRIHQLYPLEKVLTIDVSKLSRNDIFESLLKVPYGEIEFIREALIECGELNKDIVPTIRFINLPKKTQIRDLRATKDEMQFRAIPCLVKRASQVQPKILEATFKCLNGHFSTVETKYDRIVVPKQCTSYGCKNRDLVYAEVHDKKINRQFIYVQEQLENLQGGIQPSTLRCELLDDLCNTVSTGDRIVLNGVYRSLPKYKDGCLQAGKEVYFVVNSIERDVDDAVSITPEDERHIRELAADPGIFDRLTDSIAPSIIGMKLAKQAITLQLFEGVSRIMPDGTKRRGYINILLVTDPGLAKTMILKYVEMAARHAVYASAVSSSRVGLVAPLVRDEITGQYAIEAGAYMLASGGILCLDEASELSKEDWKYIGECMDNGECHITKALNATVKTEASLLAACNPTTKSGSFDPNIDLAQQVEIPDANLSRFDIKILLMDISSEDHDRKLATFMSSTYLPAWEKETKAHIILPDMLRKYITLAQQIEPVSTPESNKVIDDYYVNIRKECGNNNRMKITNRQHATLHHLAEAHARIRLSKTIDVQDAEMVIKIFDLAFRNVNTDPVSGQIDASRSSHKPKSTIDQTIISIIRREPSGAATETAIITAMVEKRFSEERVIKAIRQMKYEGTLFEPKLGTWRLMK